MATELAPIEIGILLYPHAASAMVHGLTDMFAVASTISAQKLRVSHWQLNDAQAVEAVFDTNPGLASALTTVIVPGSFQGPPGAEILRHLAAWLVARHEAGVFLCSVCGGAFVLAQTGLLAGRTATTHWRFWDQLAEQFPDISVDRSRITIEDGAFMTAGGVLAWTDLGLRLVERYLGAVVMLETAKFMLADPPGREQRVYANFTPRLRHGDAAVLKVQHWLQTQAMAQPGIAEMAALAGLEARTFLRRFHRATGLKPTEYCQHLRIDRAREMLACTRQPVETIAWAIGYKDSSSFRKIFLRLQGLSPSDYRRRFAVV